VSIKLTWLPNTESDIAQYDWQRAPDNAGLPGAWTDLVSIPHAIPGPNYDPDANRFFYVDESGTVGDWYRERAVDTDGNASGWSDPFQPSESTTPPPFPNTVILDQDYGGTNELQPVDPDGSPLVAVQVRVWKKIDFDVGNFAATVGTTSTEALGKWAQPITVEAGFTYVIQFFKPGAFGPNTQEVIIP
jgi:hypothetical protein